MFKRRLIWQLLPSYFIITIGAFGLLTYYNTRVLKQYYVEELGETLAARAQQCVILMSCEPDGTKPSTVERIVGDLGKNLQTRFTVVLPNGTVIADSEENAGRMDNHATRPEIQEALRGKTGKSIRFSETLKHETLYLALPLQQNGQITAVVRAALPTSEIVSRLNEGYYHIVIMMALTSLVLVVVSLYLVRKMTHPIKLIRGRVEKYADGDLTQRLDLELTDDYKGLTDALTRMASQLNERIQTILRQRNEQEAMLSSMVEGVIALDEGGIIINLNQACAKMFAVETDKAKGRPIHEVVNNVSVLAFVERVLESNEPVENEIELWDRDRRYLIANGTALYDMERKKIGALLVFYDITKIRHLENVRKDFVANVSHELRTPITSIKGFVETMLDGAMNNPQETERFLKIVLKQADRLNSIIGDLLTLSTVEKGYEQNSISLDEEEIKPVLNAAISLCENKANDRGTEVALDCPDDLTAKINSNLLEQAMMNLVDNAIKYSPPKTTVRVMVETTKDNVIIKVVDEGAGIEEKHLQRIFERFYRIDKGRSRDLGGTGLGLAIVKHIALAHKGNISVESILGKGSVFSITIPR